MYDLYMGMTTYPLGLTEELLEAVKRTAKETGLSQADAMRQALKFGLPQVKERLQAEGERLKLVKKGGFLMIEGEMPDEEILAAIRSSRER
jgi:hypothetical protein